jgi:hypothetical protein
MLHIPCDHLAIEDNILHAWSKGFFHVFGQCSGGVLEAFTVKVGVVFGFSRPKHESKAARHVVVTFHVELHALAVQFLFDPEGIVALDGLHLLDRLLHGSHLKCGKLRLETLHEVDTPVVAFKSNIRVVELPANSFEAAGDVEEVLCIGVPEIEDGLLRCADFHLTLDDSDQPHELFRVHVVVEVLEDGQLLFLFGNTTQFIQLLVDLSYGHVARCCAHRSLTDDFMASSCKVTSQGGRRLHAGQLPVQDVVAVIAVLVDLHKLDQ